MFILRKKKINMTLKKNSFADKEILKLHVSIEALNYFSIKMAI